MEKRLPTTKFKDAEVYPRLSISEMKDEVLGFFYLEKGLLFTFVYMLKKPAETIELYLRYDRKKVQNPFRYLFIAVAFSTFVMLANPSFKSYIDGVRNGSRAQYDKVEKDTGLPIWEKIQEAQEIAMSYQNLLVVLAIPLVSLITFLLLKKMNYNYAEHMAINCLIFGTVYWITGIYSLCTLFFNDVLLIYISWLLVFLFGSYFYWRSFSINLFKAILTLLGGYLMVILVGAVFQISIFMVLLFLK